MAAMTRTCLPAERSRAFGQSGDAPWLGAVAAGLGLGGALAAALYGGQAAVACTRIGGADLVYGNKGPVWIPSRRRRQ